MWFKKDGKVYVSMPGVPYEMKAMMQATVIPMLRDEFLPPSIVHRTILTTGMGESYLAERIARWEDGLAGLGIKLAYLPSPGLVKLRLSAYASDDPEETHKRVDEQASLLYKEIPN